MVTERKPLFPLGQIVATPGALEALEQTGQTPLEFIARHVRGDWGDVCEEDAEANQQALQDGSRILSSYRTKLDEKLWIITEADRSSSCVLKPNEY